MEIKLLVWNVYKGQRKRHFQEEMLRFGQNKDFILLQEVMLDHHMPQFFAQSFGNFIFNHASSFRFLHNRYQTGVAIGSNRSPHKISKIISSNKELFFFTPKATIACEYDWNGISILVICTHLLNFVSQSIFAKSIYEITEQIEHFNGPVIFSGDFNTWSLKRFLILQNILRELSLEHVDLKDDRFLKLDHLFIRNFDVIKAQVHTEIKGSDHLPIEATLRLRLNS